MTIGKKHIGAGGGGEMVPLLHWWRGLSWGGPPQEGRRGYLQTLCTADISQGTPVHLNQLQKGEPQSSWDWEKVLYPSQPVVAAREIPPTNQDPKAESGIKPTVQNDTDKATSLPSKDTPTPPQLSVDTSLGHSVQPPTPTAWHLWSNGLSAFSRTCGGGPRSTSRHHAHRTSSNPWDL